MTANKELVLTPAQFSVASIWAGDVIFVYDQSPGLLKKIIRVVNTYGQRLLARLRRQQSLPIRKKLTRYSHVMLGAGGGVIVHADGKTVSVEVVSDALRFGKPDAVRFEVYRRDDMTPELGAAIAHAGVRYYNQKYRFSSYFSKSDTEPAPGKGDTTQFCSRLVAHAYRAADLALCPLDDNRVLPVDLFDICQSPPWRNITEQCVDSPIPKEALDLLPPIEIPGHGIVSIPDFLENTTKQGAELAKILKRAQELRYEVIKDAMNTEAMLALLVAAQLELAKGLRVVPDQIDDKRADEIVRVLEQLSKLLDLAELPNLELIVKKSGLNSLPGDEPNIGAYAGMASPAVIEEMLLVRETLRIFTYLTLAEIGMFTILAHHVPHERFKPFRAVKAEYAQRFIDALPDVDRLPERTVASENGFLWVEADGDRSTCRTMALNIIQSLKFSEVGRRAAQRAESAGNPTA
jgi:hypothetical protein